MSLNKAIEHGKEKRTPYGKYKKTRAKYYDTTCRNHGSCSWCRRNRIINNLRKEEASAYRLNDFDIHV